jgi:hypothetical protein
VDQPRPLDRLFNPNWLRIIKSFSLLPSFPFPLPLSLFSLSFFSSFFYCSVIYTLGLPVELVEDQAPWSTMLIDFKDLSQQMLERLETRHLCELALRLVEVCLLALRFVRLK